jgi:hypothetical protein
MTTHAQPVGPHDSPAPRTGPSPVHDDDESDSRATISAARFAMIGTITTTVVGAAVTIFIAMHPPAGSSDGKSTTTTPTVVHDSVLGSLDDVTINDSGSEITLRGRAAPSVESVLAMVGPRQAGGQYWAASTQVVDQEWKVVVATDPHLPRPYEIVTQYKLRTPRPAAAGVTGYSVQTPVSTPPPPVPADQIVDCAVANGDSCFTDPSWGPPSVYRSDG